MEQYKLLYIDNRVKLLALCNNNTRVQYQQLMQYHLFISVQFRFSDPKYLLTICGPSARQSTPHSARPAQDSVQSFSPVTSRSCTLLLGPQIPP